MSLTRFICQVGREIIKSQKKKSKMIDKKINPAKSTYLRPWIDPNKNRSMANTHRADYLNYIRDMPYNEYLNTIHWQSLRERALNHFNYTCQSCGKKKNLQVHHKSYANKGFEQIELDLIVLCDTCHKKVHKIH